MPEPGALARAVIEPARWRAAFAVDTIDSAEQVACLLVASTAAFDDAAARAFVAAPRGGEAPRMARVRLAGGFDREDVAALTAVAIVAGARPPA